MNLYIKLISIFIFLLLFSSGVSSKVLEDNDADVIINIEKKVNPGNVSYKRFLSMWRELESYLPAEPRIIDPYQRISFIGMSEAERDSYKPESWAVSIVGNNFQEDVQIIRGGYFQPVFVKNQNNENLTLMFNTISRKNFIDVAWRLRVAENREYKIGDLTRAFDEVKYFQKKLPWYTIAFREELNAKFNSIKACFADDFGKILINDAEVDLPKISKCQSIKFDGKFNQSDKIKFQGNLEIVTLSFKN